jgi:hypothetical protein
MAEGWTRRALLAAGPGFQCPPTGNFYFFSFSRFA